MVFLLSEVKFFSLQKKELETLFLSSSSLKSTVTLFSMQKEKWRRIHIVKKMPLFANNNLFFKIEKEIALMNHTMLFKFIF